MENRNAFLESQARKSDELTSTLIHSKLIDESIRRKQMTEEEDKIVEKVYKTSSTLFCHFCKKDNHNMPNCIKLKHYKQFQEFSKMMKEEEARKSSEIKPTENANLAVENEDDDELILSISQSSTVKNFAENIDNKSKGKSNLQLSKIFTTIRKITNFKVRRN